MLDLDKRSITYLPGVGPEEGGYPAKGSGDIVV